MWRCSDSITQALCSSTIWLGKFSVCRRTVFWQHFTRSAEKLAFSALYHLDRFCVLVVVNWDSAEWNEDLKPLLQIQEIVSSLLLYLEDLDPANKLEWDRNAVAAVLNLRKCLVPDANDPRLNLRALHFAWIVEVARVWRRVFARVIFPTFRWCCLFCSK